MTQHYINRCQFYIPPLADKENTRLHQFLFCAHTHINFNYHGEQRENEGRHKAGKGSIRKTDATGNVTLHHTLHLVTNSSQPYMVMSITLNLWWLLI